jgi:glyoxylase-like metal-dependent hydrolase (beta-lactamase superfamily II)
MSTGTYEIFAVKYAQHARRSSANFVGGDEHDVDMPLFYYVWVVKGGGRTIVVDTGFNVEMANKRGRTLTRPVAEGLNALGVAPEQVEDVVITHLHYDHVGNHALFPKARYYLQDKEMDFATGRCMCHPMMNHGYEVDDVTEMVRRVYENRVQFVDGVREIASGIEVHHIGGHTRGLQAVRVRTNRGWVVLASDASHFYAHMEQDRAFPILYNLGDMLEGYNTLRRLATSRNHIVPGHDPLVMDRYPAAWAGAEGWIVRLDAEPKG